MSRIHSMDFVRAISVFAIIVFHLFIDSGYSSHMNWLYTKLGHYGVSFFIIASGGAIYGSIKKGFDLTSFYKKRAASILPAFWVSYIFWLVFILLKHGYVSLGSDWKLLALTATGLDGWLYNRYPNYALVGEWFIGFILVMYLIFPALVPVIKRSKWMTLGVCVLISITSFHLNGSLVRHFPFWNPDPMWNPTTRLAEFAFGIILFDLLSYGKRAALILLIASAAVISAYHISSIFFDNNLKNIPLMMAWFTLFVSAYELMPQLNFINSLLSTISKYSLVAFLMQHRVIAEYVSSGNAKFASNYDFILAGVCVYLTSFALSYALNPVVNRVTGVIFPAEKSANLVSPQGNKVECLK